MTIMKKREYLTHYYYSELNGCSPISVHVHDFISFVPHRHDFCEFEYVVEGQTNTNINGKIYPLKKGDVVFVKPVDIHGCQTPAQIPVTTITVHFSQETFPELSNLKSGVFTCSKNLQAAFNLLLNESHQNDGFSGYAVRNMLERVLILANRECKEIEPIQQFVGISSALSYIHKHFKEKITIEDVCNVCGYSISALCKNFKEETGLTVVAYINKLRLEYAERMLVTLESSVCDICYTCGFSSVRHFNRIFKDIYGCTPSEFRTSHTDKISL